MRQLEGARTSGGAPAEIENLRGLALLLDGNVQQAIAAFDRALELDAQLDAARFNRALAHQQAKNGAKAIADLEAVYADETSSLRGDAAYHLGIAADRAGRGADAEAWLDRALRLSPELDAALLYVGMLRERRNDLQGAGRAYMEYLAANPRSTAAMLRFGMSAHKAGRADVAKTYLQKVIDTAPDSADALEARKFLVMWE